MTIDHLPPIDIPGHHSSGAGTADHPMRIATRRAAGLEGDVWAGGLRHEVEGYFDELAAEWHTRTSPQRTAIVADALARGVEPLATERGLALEPGSGIGTYSGLIAERFPTVLAVDLSLAMLRLAPASPARRLRGDGSALPVRDGAASAIVLINMLLFPTEVDRVLAPAGVVVWVNSSGEQTPIHLPVDEVAAALPGPWSGLASRAGDGIWCVLRRG